MSAAEKNTYITSSLKQTEEIAKSLISGLIFTSNSATVILLSGDLGAGKTTFTKGIAKALGIKDSVISPTFILEKRYLVKKHLQIKMLIHIDAYRFEEEQEAKVLRLEESLQDPNNLIIIEWPEKLGQSALDNLLTSALTVRLESIDESTRKISW